MREAQNKPSKRERMIGSKPGVCTCTFEEGTKWEGAAGGIKKRKRRGRSII